MAECDVCGEDVSMPYHCRHCGGTYCSEHRLPESHGCPGLDNWESSGPVFDSGFDDTVIREEPDEGLLDRVGIDTGPGGPLAYFRGNMTFVFLGLMWITFALQFVVALLLEPGQPVSVTWQTSSTWEAIFVFSPENPLFVWTWVTSIFAHGGFLHIVFNSIVVYFFGRLVEQYVGWKQFAALFLVSGILAGFGQVAFNIVQGGPGVVGASGAALALMGVLTILNPNLTVYLYFILPVPIWLLTGGTAVISVFLIAQGTPGAGGIAHAAHLVGLLIGFAYGYYVRDRIRTPNEVRFGGGPGGPGGPGRGRI
jgi:membrane associated rhomboid family serine protease